MAITAIIFYKYYIHFKNKYFNVHSLLNILMYIVYTSN